jgi:tRNA pseudouridine(54/55) synthase
MKMTEVPKDSGTEEKEDWTAFANAGFGETDIDLWDDLEAAPAPDSEDEPKSIDQQKKESSSTDDDWNEHYQSDQMETYLQEIPPAPSLPGLKHLLRMGTCDHCLGRIGGKKSFGQDIVSAGIEIRANILATDPELVSARDGDSYCQFCEELFAEAPLLARLMNDALADYECSRLQIGAQFPKDQAEEEDSIRKRYGAPGSAPLKSSLVENVAKELLLLNPKIKLVNEKPQILALLDMLTLAVNLDIRSHYIYGRYRKLERGIPQTRWPCRACKGRGCMRCDGTGKQYLHSVQDSVGNPLLELFGSKEHSFHGMGREDIDVRCMGRGRPFVIEMKSPKIRSVDMAVVEKAINSQAEGRIEVDSMRDSQRSEVVRIKDTPAEKSYRIRFKLHPLGTMPAPVPNHRKEGGRRGKKGRRGKRNRRGGDKDEETILATETPVEENNVKENSPTYDEASLSILKKAELVDICIERKVAKSGTKSDLIERIINSPEPQPELPPLPDENKILRILNGLAGTTLEQRTPLRVAHRRADKIRKRQVMVVEDPVVECTEEGIFTEVSLRCESGTYVKETVHGDGGRTIPSVSSLLEADCEVLWLDVADIHAD